jgi:hypothetical protein
VSFFDDVLVERINVEAREVRFGRAILMLLAGLLYGVGWIAARTFGLIWLALAWSYTAMKVGWQEGRKSAKDRGRS